jgi:hypothetical protein
MGLAMHAIEKTGGKMVTLGMQQRRRSFDVNEYRRRNAELVARREQEVQLLERHMGRIDVSEPLPADNPFLAATISVVPKTGERLALRVGYPRVPGKTTRLPYFVDEAIKEAGFTVTSALNMSAAKLAYEPSVRLLTGNGPQAIDKQTAKLRSILTHSPAARRTSGKHASA